MRDLQADSVTEPALAMPPARQATGGSAVRDRIPGWLVALVPAAAEIVVGGYRIAGPSLWRDEAATISGSQRPIGAILAMVQNEDAVHGPYYLLMHQVIAVGGISATALRLPSLFAMCIAVAVTALLARRLAGASGLPAPGLTGLLAGLALTAVPLTTRYAQEARPYAMATMFAVLATYLLVRASAGTRRWWWVLYAAALVLTGMLNLFAVLLAAAHGVSLLVARRWPKSRPEDSSAGVGGEGAASAEVGAGRDVAASAEVADGTVRRWLVACVAAAVLLAPLAYLSMRQSAQLNWVTRPGLSALAKLGSDFSGAALGLPVVVLLGWLGCVAGRGARRGGGLTLVVVALPWLVLPPAVLLTISLVDPIYVERYVLFCLPALSLLAAAGLVWLTELSRPFAVRRGLAGWQAKAFPLVPSAVLTLLLVSVLVGPQHAVRQADARADNLRAVAAVVAGNELPGDAILYLPWKTDLIGVAYPAPFASLRNIGFGESPTASATLRGLPVSPRVIAARIRTVRRLWTVRWADPLTPDSAAPADLTRLLTQLRLIGRWRVGSVTVSLYAVRQT
ncbi:MAG TPA: glycosyltransferase family 39 protein [Streptosporangiaceae bacterium]|nr:glycosyltransferase family 39 protein [Streptosporangiaceae bacterium]